MLTRLRMIRRAKRNGVLMPRRLYRAAKWARIPYWVACSFAMQETSWPQTFCGHGDGIVRKTSYRIYRVEAERTGKRQGVGPLQLTHWSYQQRADELGGCWKPYHNMQAGLEPMRGWKTAGATWPDVARRYNPSDKYVREMTARFKFWRDVMKGLEP